MRVRHQTILCCKLPVGGEDRAGASIDQASARHQAGIQQIVQAYDGALLARPAPGLAGLFANPLDAVWAALEAQRLLEAHGEGCAAPRIALHSRVAQHPSAPPSGSMLLETEELLAVAQAGQILLSHEMALLICDALPADLELYEAEGVGPERGQPVFELSAAGSPAGRPTQRRRPWMLKLPPQPTTLIGRAAERAQVARLLGSPDVRLLTLAGLGGVGKTHLAREVAFDLSGMFDDGIFFVPLDTTPDLSLLASAIAEALEVEGSAESSLQEAIHEYLQPRKSLLILDNFDHLVSAAGIITDMLAAAPGLRCLVTSREPLGLAGERHVMIPPLELPPAAAELEIGAALRYPVVRLFVERARAAWKEFKLTPENVDAIVKICRRLNGLPFAIELAAVYSKIFQPQALLDRLTDSLPLPAHALHDLPAPGEIVLRTIAWSYALLSRAEQRLFMCLGVFAGSWEREAVEAIYQQSATATSSDEPQVVELLLALLNKGLIVQRGSRDGEPRFTIYDTIRQYALERLAESGAEQEVRRRHALYYVGMAEQAKEGLRLGDDLWLARLDVERNNLYAAFHWALEQGEQEIVLRFFHVPWRYRGIHHERNEVAAWLEQAISGNRLPWGPKRAELVCMTGWMAFDRGDYLLARRFFEESLALARECEAPREIALALHGVGEMYQRQGDSEQALASYEESLQLFRELDGAVEVAWSLDHIGRVLLERREYAQARAMLEESLALFRSQGSQWAECFCLNHLGTLALRERRLQDAQALFELALAIAHELDDTRHIARTRQNLGLVAIEQRSLGRAQELLSDAYALLRNVGSQFDLAVSLEAQALLAFARGQTRQSVWLLGAAEALREELGEHGSLIDRAGYAGLVAALEAQLGVADFALAWRQGRVLDPEQALSARELSQLVLRQAPEPSEPSEPPEPVEPAQEQSTELPLGLRARELDVLRLVAAGLTNAEIAQRLYLSPHTVNNHLRSIYRKLKVSTRLAASKIAIKHGLT